MDQIFVSLLYGFPIVTLVLLLFVFRNRGFWICLYDSLKYNAIVSAAGWFIISLFILKDGGFWLAIFIAFILFFVFRLLAVFANIPASYIRAKSEYQNADQIDAPKNFKHVKEKYFKDMEKSEGRPLKTMIQKADHIIEQAESIHDISQLNDKETDLSPGGTVQLLMAVLFFILFYSVFGNSIGHGKGIMIFFEIGVCAILSMAAASATWSILPSSLRITGRIAVILWPITLLGLYWVFSWI